MTVCDVKKCTGCYACSSICPKKCITIEDKGDVTFASIDNNLCIKCKLCESVCQVYNESTFNYPKKCFEGWALNKSERKTSSSGGVASSLMRNFIEKGGYVASCLFKDGEFKFQLSNKVSDIESFKGSKYIKSKPYDIYIKVRECLKSNKVLFIGLPCQVVGLLHFLKGNNCDNLFTIDLICHGSPSQLIFNKYYYEQTNIKLTKLKKIEFRKKHNFQVYCDDESMEFDGIQDAYTIAFLEGLTYTENCYSCKYARIERISDITLGDSWSYSGEDAKKGVSLILVQSEKGESLLDNKDLYLADGNIDDAINSNHQLEHPSVLHPKRKLFFKIINEKGFRRTIKKLLPKKYYKQKIKKYLIKFKLYK